MASPDYAPLASGLAAPVDQRPTIRSDDVSCAPRWF
jgi:hypothetical protein